MQFLIDAQLPPQLCKFFAERGHIANHVFESFQHDADDAFIFDFAKSASLIVVTKDDDFVRRSDALGAPPQILWLRIGNCRNPALFAALASAWANIVAALERGERVVELRAR